MAPSDFDSIQLDPVSQDPFAPQQPKSRPWFDLGDMALAPARGLIGAVKGAYNLVDTITGDFLPDWKKNPLGESNSIAGSLLEGATQFTAGFLPFGGGLGFAGLIPEVAEGAGALATIGRVAGASAAASFTAFEGHTGRLADLLEEHPTLLGPVTEFLSAATSPLRSQKDDPELLGRLKNAIEASGLGAFTEGIVLGLKGIKAGHVATAEADAAGLTGEAKAAKVNEAVAQAAPADQMEAAVRQSQGQMPEDIAKAMGVEAPPPEAQATPPKAPAPQAVPGEAPSVEAPKAAAPEVSAEAPAAAPKEPVPGVSDTPERSGRLPILKDLGLDDKQIAKFNDAFEAKQLAYEGPGAGIPEQIPGGLNPRTLGVADRVTLGLQATDLNLKNFATPDRAKILQRTIEDLYRHETASITDVDQVKSLEQMAAEGIKETAAMTGVRSPEAFAANVAVRSGKTLNSLRELAPRVLSDRYILADSAKQWVEGFDRLKRVQSGLEAGNADKMILESAQSIQFLAGLQASVRGQAREAGRLLRSFAVKVGDAEIPNELLRLADDPAKLAQTLNDAGGRDFLLKALDKMRAAFDGGGPEALHKAVQTTVGRRFLAMTTEAFMGSVLSSPKTAVVNFFGHTFGAFYLPLERALGSMAIRMTGGRLAPAIDVALQDPIVAESFNQLMQIKASAQEAFRLVKDSGFSPENTLTDARITERFARQPAITAANVGLPEDSLAGRAVDWIGKAARFPTEVLGAADNFAKNTIYRQYARGRFTTEALQAGIKDPAAIAEHVESRLQQLIVDGQAYNQQTVLQRGVNLARESGITDQDAISRFATDYYAKNFDESLSSLSKEAIDHTNVATFTNRAQRGTFTHSFQRLIAKHPSLRLIAPFVNTPANLLKAAAQRADAVGVTRYIVGRVWPETMPTVAETSNRFLQDMLSGDPVKAANAVGRVSAGSAAAVFFVHEALAGNITGRGPADKNQRQAMMDAGWLPYSIKVGDSYVSYARLDPFSTFIGTAADFAAALNHAEDVGDEDIGTVAGGLASACANNFTNKSYLTGVANLIAALQEPEKQVPAFFRKQAAAFVPNVLATAGYGVGEDPTMREVRTVMDGIMAKIPGLSDKLPPRRNILGEPLERPRTTNLQGPAANLVETWNPVLYSETKSDTVKQELAALGHSWEPPKRTMGGLDLMDVRSGNTNAYDRWQELQGSVTVGGQTLRQALEREIRSREYQRLPQESTVQSMSPRVERITRIVNDYRERARQQLLRELPDLKKQVDDVGALRRQRRRGIESSIIPGT